MPTCERAAKHANCELMVTGDFNLAPTDRAFKDFEGLLVPVIDSECPTTIANKHCYDNIWVHDQQYKHKGSVLKWDDMYPQEMFDRLLRVSKYCSDHRPVYIDCSIE
jgi:hypothetical protein